MFKQLRYTYEDMKTWGWTPRAYAIANGIKGTIATVFMLGSYWVMMWMLYPEQQPPAILRHLIQWLVP